MDWFALLGAFGVGSVSTTIIGGLLTYFLTERSKKRDREFLIAQKYSDELKKNRLVVYRKIIKFILEKKYYNDFATDMEFTEIETDIIIFASEPVQCQFKNMKEAYGVLLDTSPYPDNATWQFKKDIYDDEANKLIEKIKIEADKL